MTPPSPDLTRVVERLDNLERQNRRLRRTVCGLLLLVGALALWAVVPQGRAQTKGDAKQADEFVLRDAQGKTRVRVAMDKDVANLVFSDDKDRRRATMSVGQAGMFLRVLGEGDKLQSGLSVEADGVALVATGRDGRVLTGPSALKTDAGLLIPQTGRETPRPPQP
jgi:hypothetical protein